jgi:hypothetical protein
MNVEGKEERYANTFMMLRGDLGCAESLVVM